MNKDEVKGKTESFKGRLKQAAGVITNDPELEREGADQRSGGALQEKVGKTRRKVGEAIEDLGKKIGR